MKAEIISVGTELLLGTITDTNAAFLAQRLAELGIDCYYVSQVGDNLERLTGVLRQAWNRSDLTVTTGGLGPTQDDITREAIGALLEEAPTLDEALAEELRGYFRNRGVPMPERNLKQAMLIPSAQPLRNAVGTAPGWWVAKDSARGQSIIVSLPGVPFEMVRMWEREVEPRLRYLGAMMILSRTLKVLGLGESAVEEKVADLMNGSNPTLAPYAKRDGVHLRITAKAIDERAAAALIDPLEAAVRERLGEAIYGVDRETPAEAVDALLQRCGTRLAILEVGECAIGSISPLLGRSDMCASALAVRDYGALAQLLHSHSDGSATPTLESGARALMTLAGAGAAVGVEARCMQVEGDPERSRSRGDEDAVGVEAELVVLSAATSLMPGPGGQARLRRSFRTAQSEVARLVGLAGVDLLRRYLLKHEKEVRR